MAARRPRRPARVAERPPTDERLLLDTHVWLWWQAGNRSLGDLARRAITDAVEVYFSMASAWEIAIKISLGKLSLPRSADIAAELAVDGFAPLGIEFAHTSRLAAVPAHHRDPFDRMLIAQAMVEDLTIVSADPWFSRYDVRRLDASR